MLQRSSGNYYARRWAANWRRWHNRVGHKKLGFMHTAFVVWAISFVLETPGIDLVFLLVGFLHLPFVPSKNQQWGRMMDKVKHLKSSDE
jgi:hypothetical protein